MVYWSILCSLAQQVQALSKSSQVLLEEEECCLMKLDGCAEDQNSDNSQHPSQ